MSEINDFHHAAVDYAARAMMERMRGNTEEAAVLFEQALENELAAIGEMAKRGSMAEPTYSVLHRSAGWMAFHCNRLRLTEQLAAKGLAHTPHPEIAEELLDLLEQVHSRMRLGLEGVALAAGD